MESLNSRPPSQRGERIEEIRRVWRLEAQAFPRARMDEGQSECVQHLAWGAVAGQLLEALVLTVAVSRIADERVTKELEVHANLMRAAGVQQDFGEGGALEPLQDAVAGARRPPDIIVDRHPLAVRRMTGYCGPNFSFVPLHFAADDGVIGLIHCPSGELGGESQVGVVVFGHDQAAAGFFVQAMHDARAGHAADAAQLAFAMVQQGIDEGMLFVADGRMHDQAGLLVQDHERFVFEQDLQRDLLRLREGRPRLGPMDIDLVPGARSVGRLYDPAVDADMTLFNEALNRAARDRGELLAEKSVEPPRRDGPFDDQDFAT